MEKSWSLSGIWNHSISESRDDKPLEPRDRIYASELGKPFIDRYLKMKAVKPTNPPNARSKRKMEAGKMWESLVKFVLSRAGIMIEHQERLEYQYPGLLPVSGRLDFIAGGKPDYEKSKKIIEAEFTWLPESIKGAALTIVESLSQKYPDGLKEIVLEVKSCSGHMYDIYEAKEKASQHHVLQTYHYLKTKSMPEGHVAYISRDDARILEIGVFNPSQVEENYKRDIETMTGYYKREEMPPKEKLVVFDELTNKFKHSWGIEYSSYLTFLYGFETPMEYRKKCKPMASRWNRVLKRIIDGEKMTDDNRKAIDEMNEDGFNAEELSEKIKAEKITIEEETNDDDIGEII